MIARGSRQRGSQMNGHHLAEGNRSGEQNSAYGRLRLLLRRHEPDRQSPIMARHILLADASPTIHTLVRLLLAGEAVDVTIATSTAQALAAMEARDGARPGLVLADTMLAGDGIDLARQLAGRVPVVLLVAPHASLEPGAAAAVGALGVLPKPFDRPTLLGLLRRVYGAEPGAEAPSPAPAPNPTAELAALARDAVERALAERLDRAVGEAVAARTREAVARALDQALDQALDARLEAAVQRLVGERSEAIIRAELERLLREDD